MIRRPTRITVQYRQVPYLPDQVRIIRHFGRGIPLEYFATTKRPRLVNNTDYLLPHQMWTEHIREHLAKTETHHVDVLAPEITRY